MLIDLLLPKDSTDWAAAKDPRNKLNLSSYPALKLIESKASIASPEPTLSITFVANAGQL